jgi:hypothetical protein
VAGQRLSRSTRCADKYREGFGTLIGTPEAMAANNAALEAHFGTGLEPASHLQRLAQLTPISLAKASWLAPDRP